MFIKNLKINNLRNLINSEYTFNKKINIFYGDNGVGKTSILEAIHYLSTGKSFRKGNSKNLINFNSDELTIFIQANDNKQDYSLAVNKHKNNRWKGRINHNNINKQSEITSLIPVVSIDPEIYRLVDYGPIYRRNYLDWLVFHVKHDYLLLWKKTYRCIKQLNSLYKLKAHDDELTVWEKNLVIYSEELTQIRKKFFNEIHPLIVNLFNDIQTETKNLSIVFKQGWSNDLSLNEQLKKDRFKNKQYGSLQHGPHKMDIQINIENQAASHILSRGQKKILSIVFYMAYIKTLTTNKIKPILCLDDFDAELDSVKLKKAVSFFESTQLQIFVTTVQKENIQNAFTEPQMFHVEQCEIH